jgi:methylmalonyl-CoA mutase N-terminal domain/subunit
MEEGAYRYFRHHRFGWAAWWPPSSRAIRSARSLSRRTAFSRRSRRKEKLIVGVNAFVEENEVPHPILYIDESAARARSGADD